MSNVRQKPANQLVYRRGGRGRVPALPPIPTVCPDPPPDLGDYALERWSAFWSQPVSGLVDLRRDGGRLDHWIKCIDQRARLWEMWRAMPLLRDANKDLRSNPLYRQIIGLSQEIERAEQKFGMTPLDKMRLTGALDEAEGAEESISKRRESYRPSMRVVAG